MPLKGARPSDGQPFAYEEIAPTNGGAVPFTGPNGALANFDFAWLECETANIRIRVDGGAPTTTSGHLYNPGTGDVMTFQEMKTLLAIATAATGLLRATYYRYK